MRLSVHKRKETVCKVPGAKAFSVLGVGIEDKDRINQRRTADMSSLLSTISPDEQVVGGPNLDSNDRKVILGALARNVMAFRSIVAWPPDQQRFLREGIQPFPLWLLWVFRALWPCSEGCSS